MMRALAKWLFMRTHRAQLVDCARYARSESKSSFEVGQRDGVVMALEKLGLLA